MTPNLFAICQPRDDVLKGTLRESDFAADLAQVLRGDAPEEYKRADLFFANTYPTKGLRNVLRLVAQRVAGRPEQIGAIFRLDTQFGGGKTHTLIALAHAMRGLKGVPGADEFLDPVLQPTSPVRIAAFDGENADPANGRRMSDKVRAFTPWGELAYALAGDKGYDLVRASDEAGVAPGAETLRELIGKDPALILLDELAPYLRKVSAKNALLAGQQLAAFLTSLMKAVESSPLAALVFTLAMGRDGRAGDAYTQETQDIAAFIAEAESVAARKATLIDPTEDDETVKVLCRRLFARIDETKAREVVAAYKALWDAQREVLPPAPAQDRRTEEFLAGYPLHPELIRLLTQKTATLENFQRVRGMLRLLARTIGRLWSTRPADAYAIHTHHVDLAFEPIRNEIVTRLNQQAFVSALKAEIATTEQTPAFAQQLDASAYVGLPAYGSYVARTVFLHTLAFNEPLRGLSPEELRYAIASPGTDIAFIDDARKRFVVDSAYLDDKPKAPLRFLAEANLTQIIRRQEANTDPGEVRSRLNDTIRQLFAGPVLSLVPFTSGPHDVPDDDGNGKPYLVLIGTDAASVSGDAVRIDPLIAKIFAHKGSSGDWRLNRNNLVFLLADGSTVDNMRARMLRHLALEALRSADKLAGLADYQVKQIHERYERSKQELANAVQQCYRHVLYPSRNRIEGASVDLAHTVIDIQTASERPGDGQKQVVTQLQQVSKLRCAGDQPDSPAYIRDRTPLKKGQVTTAALRNEFRQDVTLPILVGDDVFLRGIRQGIDLGEYVYQSGDLVRGKGDPMAEIKIDEQSVVFTAAYARERGIWPRQPAAARPEPPPFGLTSPVVPPIQPEPLRDDSIRTEGVLKAALAEVFERARDRKVASFARLTIRPFDAGDALKLLPLIKSVPNAAKRVELKVEYVTPTESEATVVFRGDLDDASHVKDFLEPQLRASKESLVEVLYQISFSPALPTTADSATRLIERLTRLVSPSAEVVAIPEVFAKEPA